MTSSLTNFVVSIMFLKVFPASGINGIMRYRKQVQRRMDAGTNGNLAIISGQFTKKNLAASGN